MHLIFFFYLQIYPNADASEAKRSPAVLAGFYGNIFVSSNQILAPVANKSYKEEDLAGYLDSLYKVGEYERVIKEGEALLDKETKREKRVEILRIVAFAFVALEIKEPAKEKFLSILSIAPNFYLDPINTSPKILAVFEEAKSEFLRQWPPLVRKKATDYSPLIYFYPGLYQIKNNSKTKGWTLLSLESVSILGFFATSILTPIYHQRYLEKRIPEDIREAYSRYMRFYIGRQVFGIGIFFSYGLHLLDLKLSKPR